MKFCCVSLKNECTVLNRRTKRVKRLFVYRPEFRCVGVAIGDEGGNMPITYCPFCGKKQLPDLCNEYWETVIAEVGEEYYPTNENYDPKRPVPTEFQTEEWWKKRGL